MRVMISFQPNNLLNKKLIELENAFVLTYAKIQNFDEATKKAIHRYARISSIGSSTRIENALLTDSEIEWLDTVLSTDGKTTSFSQNKRMIENKLSKERERSIEEVTGCRNMMFLIYNNYEEMFPLKQSDIRALHFELMKIYQGATLIGEYKNQPNFVIETNNATKNTRTVFKTADAGPMTSSSMTELVNWYNDSVNENENTFLIAGEFTYRFLAIHPFQDGNGRLGRGLYLLNLLHSPNLAIKAVAPYLSIDREIEKRKEEYYFTLNRCSNGQFKQDPKEYRIEYFCAFMIKILSAALSNIDLYYKKYLDKKSLSETASNVLLCFNEYPEIRLSNKQIVEMTKLPRRTVANALKTLKDKDMIQSYGEGAGTRYQITF